MAHDVFISYASKDKPAADALCATMEANGVRCWIAPRDIAYGADWGEAIVDAISASRAMVLVFSSSANGSPHIKREVDRAVSKGVTIIPIRIEDVAPARALEYYISPVHWLDAVTPPMERHFTALAEKVRLLLTAERRDAPLPGEAPVAAAPAPRAADVVAPGPAAPATGPTGVSPAPRPAPRSLPPLVWLGGGAAAAAVAAMLWLQPWKPGPDPAAELRKSQQIVEEARRAMEAARAADERRRAEDQRRTQDAERQRVQLEQQRRQEEARRNEDARRAEEARRAAEEAQRRTALLQQQLQQLQQQRSGPGAPARADAGRRDPFVIKAQVEQQLRSRGLLKHDGGAWGVTVDVAPTGAVTLTGIVQSGAQRTESVRLAGAVPGVTEVRPQINVRESWAR